MKNILTSLFILCCIRCLAQDETNRIAFSEQKEFLQYKSDSIGAINNNNIIYQRLELQVDPAVDFIAGKVITYFIPSGAIQFIEFDLDDTLSVDSVIFHNNSVPFSHTGDIIHIPFSSPVSNEDSVAVYYHGVPVSGPGFGSFVQTKHSSDSVPIIWTLSEPYGAKDWWPCKQALTDKIDSLDVIITTPQAYAAASNGLLVAVTPSGGNKIYYWKHRYPIATYLVCMAVTNYCIYYNYVPFGNDTIPVMNFVYAEDSATLAPQSSMVVPMMQLYDSLFGLYPFNKEKYGMVEFGWGGGMEHQTMTFTGSFGFDLVSHELAHHWFGDKVTCASWHDIWLNEGFAVYLNVLCYEHLAPEWFMAAKTAYIGNSCNAPNGSVWCDDTTSVSRIFSGILTYAKGAMVLNMLRWELGDSIFFSGLRSYLSDVNNAFAFASTPALQSHLEAASGRDLSQFFNNWVYGKGFPSYQIGWTQDFSNHVELTIGQTQSDPSVSFFPMPVPIQFKNAYQDTTIIFDHTSSGQTFSLNLPFAADSVVLDPDLWLISRYNTITRNSAYNFSMFLYPNPVSNILQMVVQTSANKSADIKIFNSSGQIVLKYSANLEAGANNLPVNVASWNSGTYHVSIQSGGNSLKSSFVVIGAK